MKYRYDIFLIAVFIIQFLFASNHLSSKNFLKQRITGIPQSNSGLTINMNNMYIPLPFIVIAHNKPPDVAEMFC